MASVGRPLRWVSFGVGVVALLLLVLSLLFPWSQGDLGFGGERFSWGVFGGEVVQDDDEPRIEWMWHDEYIDESDDDLRLDDMEGVPLIRWAMPIYLVGLVALLVGAILLVTLRGPTGGILSLAASLLVVVSMVLLVVGIGEFEDDLFGGSSERLMESGPGQILAFLGGPLALVGGVLGFVAGLLRPATPAHGAPADGGPGASVPSHPPPMRPVGRDRFRLEERHRR